MKRPELGYTGERHMTGLVGVDLSLGHIEHMVRYASASPFVVGKRVLDIACGSGYGSQFLALQGAQQVVGVDIDHTTIEYAKTFHDHPGVTYLCADAHVVPELEDASFDVIVCFETIEHVQRPRDLVLELRRLLKPRGQCFISCPNDHRVSPWKSEFHLNRFSFTEFRDLVVAVFDEVILLGQHNTCTSSLLRPCSTAERHVPFGAYREPLPPGFFGNQYADSIEPIENAAGYFAIVGEEAASFGNHVSVSENVFQQVLTSMHFRTEEAKKAQIETATVRLEVVELRQLLQAEEALRAEHDASHAREVNQLQERFETEQRLRAQVEAARGQEVQALEQQQRVVAEQEAAHHQQLAALREQLASEQRGRAQVEAARAQEVQALDQQHRVAAEQEAAHHQQLAALREQLASEQRGRAQVEAARAQEVQALDQQHRVAAEQAAAHHHQLAALQEQLAAEQRGRAQVEAARAQEVQALDQQHRVAAEQAAAHHQQLAALREQLASEQRGRAQVEAARAQEVQALDQQHRVAAEQAAAHHQQLATLREQLASEQRGRAQVEAARAQEVQALDQQRQEQQRVRAVQESTHREQLALLQEQLAAEQGRRVQVEAAWAQEMATVAEARNQATHLEGELGRLRGTIESMESSKFWKLRTAWFRVKRWPRGGGAS